MCTWTHHSSKLAQQHGLGLQCRSTDLHSSLKQTIWNDPQWNGRWSSVVSLWDLCCRHGTAESSLREVFGQSVARIQPANQSSAPELPRPRRYLWDRGWEKSALHLSGDQKRSSKLGLFNSNAWSEPEEILPPTFSYFDFCFRSSFLFSFFSWKSCYK